MSPTAICTTHPGSTERVNPLLYRSAQLIPPTRYPSSCWRISPCSSAMTSSHHHFHIVAIMRSSSSAIRILLRRDLLLFTSSSSPHLATHLRSSINVPIALSGAECGMAKCGFPFASPSLGGSIDYSDRRFVHHFYLG